MWEKFEKLVPLVTEDYINGLTPKQIAGKNSVSEKVVRSIIAKVGLKSIAEEHRQELFSKTLQEKIPLLREVMGLTLLSLKDFLEALYSDEERKAALTVKEAKDLSSIAKDLNEIIRLELGQSTQNIEMVTKVEHDVTFILEDLRKKDPFVDYPQLPEKTGEIIEAEVVKEKVRAG